MMKKPLVTMVTVTCLFLVTSAVNSFKMDNDVRGPKMLIEIHDDQLMSEIIDADDMTADVKGFFSIGGVPMFEIIGVFKRFMAKNLVFSLKAFQVIPKVWHFVKTTEFKNVFTNPLVDLIAGFAAEISGAMMTGTMTSIGATIYEKFMLGVKIVHTTTSALVKKVPNINDLRDNFFELVHCLSDLKMVVLRAALGLIPDGGTCQFLLKNGFKTAIDASDMFHDALYKIYTQGIASETINKVMTVLKSGLDFGDKKKLLEKVLSVVDIVLGNSEIIRCFSSTLLFFNGMLRIGFGSLNCYMPLLQSKSPQGVEMFEEGVNVLNATREQWDDVLREPAKLFGKVTVIISKALSEFTELLPNLFDGLAKRDFGQILNSIHSMFEIFWLKLEEEDPELCRIFNSWPIGFPKLFFGVMQIFYDSSKVVKTMGGKPKMIFNFVETLVTEVKKAVPEVFNIVAEILMTGDIFGGVERFWDVVENLLSKLKASLKK